MRFRSSVKLMAAGGSQIIAMIQSPKIFHPTWLFRLRERLAHKIAPKVPLGVWLVIELTGEGKLRVQHEPQNTSPAPLIYDLDHE